MDYFPYFLWAAFPFLPRGIGEGLDAMTSETLLHLNPFPFLPRGIGEGLSRESTRPLVV